MPDVRFAVLSDLHVWRRKSEESWALARKAFRAAADAEADHVIIAGDLFDCATAFSEDADEVRKELELAGLWASSKLTIVPGNHDIFHTAHRGTWWDWWAEFGKASAALAGQTYAQFGKWAGDLIEPKDRLAKGDLFPSAKKFRHVLLLAADSTGYDTNHSVNGYWREESDAALRRACGASHRTVLAMHHPPEASPERLLLERWRGEPSFGFPPVEFARLQRFAEEVQLENIVCGHIHQNGGRPWNWTLENGTRVHMVGRTGGVHDATPCIGLLTVPESGETRWRTQLL